VSQNFLCFSSKVNSRNIRLPYTKLTSVVFEPGALGDKVVVKDDHKPYIFSNFGLKQARESYELIMYLRENPPNYVDMEAINKYEAALKAQAQSQASSQQQMQAQRPVVQTALADSLLSLALDADMTQNQVVDTVARQGQQIDRLAASIDTVDGKLQRAEHLIRGIESYRYYMFGKQKKKNSKKREEALAAKTNKLPPNTPPTIEIDILFKRQDDSLHPAILILEADNFRCVDPVTDKLMEKNSQYKLANIESFVMRARHEHADFRFKGTGPVRERRCRIMSSYLQALTNQIWFRCQKIGVNVNIVFEPGVNKFEYKDSRVCVMPQASRDGAASNAHGANAPKVSSLMSPGLDNQTKADLDYVDDALTQALQVTRDIRTKAENMNVELARQNDVLAKSNSQVDSMIAHTQNMNQRLDHQCDKY